MTLWKVGIDQCQQNKFTLSRIYFCINKPDSSFQKEHANKQKFPGYREVCFAVKLDPAQERQRRWVQIQQEKFAC